MSRLETLNLRVGEIEGDLRKAPSADWEKQATKTESAQVLECVQGSALIEAQPVHATLARIDARTYRDCSICGETIGEKRLMAQPAWSSPTELVHRYS